MINLQQKCNQDKLESLKDKFNADEVDFSNGLARQSDQMWAKINLLRKIPKVKVLHLQRNENPVVVMQICHIKFNNLKKLVLQNNRITNLEAICFLDSPNLQQIDVLKNKFSNISFVSKSKFTTLHTFKLTLDTVTEGWSKLYRGHTNLKSIYVSSFHNKMKPINYSKLYQLSKCSSCKNIKIKINNYSSTQISFFEYIKQFRVNQK